MPPARLPKRRAGDASRSVVHTRLNDPQAGIRNPCINFITAQPQADGSDAEALDRLNQLAALFKPIMQEYHFKVNSLEEFEPNDEFLGRNWNNGETIELVLRDRRNPNRFVPLSFVARVFCHELAHIAHMNHLAPHTKLTGELCREVRRLQSTGYYGDGFWSAGRTLEGDSVQGMSQLQPDFLPPRETCGGAYRRRGAKRAGGSRRPTKRRARMPGAASSAGPSLTSGAQTGRTIKPGVGARRLGRDLPGSGGRVDGRDDLPKASAKSNSYKDDPNSTFRKHAQSKSARELRAEAAQLRMFAQKQSAADAAAEVEEAFAEFDDTFCVREQRELPEQEEQSVTESETDSEEEGAVFYESETASDEEVDQLDGEAPLRTQASKVITCHGSPPHKASEKGKQRERERSASRVASNANGNGNGAASSSKAPATHKPRDRATLEFSDSDSDDDLEIVGVKRTTKPPAGKPAPKRDANGVQLPRTWGDLHRTGHLYSNATLPKPSKFRGDKMPPPPPRPVAGRSGQGSTSSAGEQQQQGEEAGAWTCQVCSLINTPAARRCDACETSKGSSLLGE